MNTAGQLFRVSSWGESHGKAMGALIDGCPAGLELEEEDIRRYLARADRPIPEIATQRQEPNRVEILSGVERGVTLGTPIALLIPNLDFRPADYSRQKQIFRPGHGDYSYYCKYGRVASSGGGRASGRECISRLAAGFIAEKLIKQVLPDYKVSWNLTEMAGIKIQSRVKLQAALNRVEEIAKEQDSSGGAFQMTVSGLPAGLGNPVFAKLDGLIAAALMGIGGVKAVEIGAGVQAAGLKGSQMNDSFGSAENRAGGILAGISTGEPLELCVYVKPTPSIAQPQRGISAEGEAGEVITKGRHDRNFTPRAAEIAASMIHLLMADQLMLRGQINRDCLC